MNPKKLLSLLVIITHVFSIALPPNVFAATFNDFSVFASNSVHIKPKAVVETGFIGVNDIGTAPFLDPDAQLAIGASAVTGEDVNLIAPNVEVSSLAVINGDIEYLDNLIIKIDAQILGNTTQLTPDDFPVTSIPSSPTCTPDSNNPVNVPKVGSQTLQPGSYGDADIGLKATLTLESGFYSFQSISTKAASKIFVNGPVTICVEDKFASASKLFLGPHPNSSITAADIKIFVNGINDTDGALSSTPKAVRIGAASKIFARFQVPNGTLELASSVIAEGSLFGKDVVVGLTSIINKQTGADSTPPAITNIQPVNGSTTATAQPVISADYFDTESGIDVAAVRLLLDSTDVTSQSTVTATSITFNPITFQLSEGAHTAEFEVADNAMNFALAQTTFTVPPSGPELDPIGDQSVEIGTTLNLQLTATNPGANPLTFIAQPVPLPTNMTFNAKTGRLVFKPARNQTGDFDITFKVTDGVLSDSETITINVPPLLGVTTLSGSVITTNNAPLANVRLVLGLNNPIETFSQADGSFFFNNAPSGNQRLLVDGSTVNPVLGTFATVPEMITLINGANNILEPPIVLLPLDVASGDPVDPNAESIVTSSDIIIDNVNFGPVILTIPAGSPEDEQTGLPFSGNVFITNIPDPDLGPRPLPDDIDLSIYIAVQPFGVVYNPPAEIAFPNVDNFPAGSLVDIFGLNHDTGEFEVVGAGEVLADGMVHSLGGVVHNNSWHGFVVRPPELFPGPDNNNGQNEDALLTTTCGGSAFGSEVCVQSGDLTIEHETAAHISQGESRNLRFIYHSTSAEPKPIIPIESVLTNLTPPPDLVSMSLKVGGIDQGNEIFSQPNLSQVGLFFAQTRMAQQFDATSYPTGIYPYEFRQNCFFPQSRRSLSFGGNIFVRNEMNSPFGAGWTLEGLDRIELDQNGDAILIEGNGSIKRFIATEPLNIGSFDTSRAGIVSFTDGNLFDQARASLSNNFSDVTLSSFPTITSASLTDVDTLVVSSVGSLGDALVTLSSSEQTDLVNFVEQGGCAVVLLDSEFFALANASFADPFGLSTGLGGGTATIADPLISPITSGPFGAISSFLQQFSGAISNLGPNALGLATVPGGFGLAVIEEDKLTPGSGPIIFYSDINTFTDSDNFGLFPTGLHEELFLNTMGVCAQNAVANNPANSVINYRTPAGDFSQFVKNSGGTFTRTLKDGTRFEFDINGLLTAKIDRNGNTTSYMYDLQGRLIQITDPAGLDTFLSYSGNSLSTITDPAGRTTTFTHDPDGNLTDIIDPDNSTRTFVYDSNHKLISQSSKRSFVTTYDYNFASRVSQANRPDSTSAQFIPSEMAGLVDTSTGVGTQFNPAPPPPLASEVEATLTDGRGNSTKFNSDRFGSITKTEDPIFRVTTIERDLNGNPIRIIKSNGAQSVMFYDAQGNLIFLTEAFLTALSRTTNFEYEPVLNQITKLTDPAGKITIFEYDANGNLTKITDPLLGEQQFTYNAQGLLLTSTDENNNTTTFSYDSKGNLASQIDALSNVTDFTRDAAGSIINVTEGVGNTEERTLSFSYDVLNRLTSSVDGENALTQFRYDEEGNLIETENSTGEISKKTYDERNRVIQSEDPVNGITQFDYDGNGNLISITDSLNNTKTLFYDNANQLTRSDDPFGVQTRFTYDAVGNATTIQTGIVGVTLFEYDKLDRLTKVTNSSTGPRTFSYDSRDNLVGIVDRNSQSITNTYDDLSRLTQTVTPDNTVNITYDAVGNILTAADNDSSLSYTYDSLNRVLTASTINVGVQPAVTLTNVFDSLSNRTQLIDSIGGTSLFDYDKVDRLTQLTTPSSQIISLSYDSSGRLKDINFPNSVISELQYNAFGQLANITHQLGLTNLSSFDYLYNPLGNITSIDEQAQVKNYTYDSLQQLTSGGTAALSEAYGYDEDGNRINSHLSNNALFNLENRLFDDDDFTYSYDNEGNLLTKTAKAGGAVTTYAYDAQNQLIQIDHPGLTTTTYKYDALGRRIEKNDNGIIARYIYDGEDIVLEYNGTNALLARYSHGDQSDQPLSQERSGQDYFYHFDHLGSIRQITNINGIVVNEYDYDSFGRILSSTEAVANPYTFAGREFDPESGLYYYRARYYDPQVGRFISEDPLEFDTGDANFYRYVFNNPVNLVDPSGEIAFVPILIAIGIGAVAGGVTDAAIETGTQLVEAGGDINCLDVGKIGEETLKGAAIGAVTGGVLKTAATGIKLLSKQRRVSKLISGRKLNNIRKIKSGRLKGFVRGTSELRGGQSGAKKFFQELTGKNPQGSFDRVILSNNNEIIFRSTSTSGPPKIEIINRAKKVFEKISFIE